MKYFHCGPIKFNTGYLFQKKVLYLFLEIDIPLFSYLLSRLLVKYINKPHV